MSAPKKEKEEGSEGQAAAPKKSKKMLFIIIGVIVLLVGAGVPTMMLLGGDAEEGKEKEPEFVEPVLETWQLEPIVVNLSESTSYLKVTLVIEYDLNIVNAAAEADKKGGKGHGGGAAGGSSEPKGPPGAVGTRMMQMKDAIIGKLSSKTAAEILSYAGKEQLKEELVEVINDAIGLDESPVVQVYFLEFIIQ